MLTSVYLHRKTKIVFPSWIKDCYEDLIFLMNTTKLTIFFDGCCPLCKREVDFLQSKNQEATLKFIDINTPGLSLEHEYGITYRQAMERIHAIESDGSVIKDIKVFQDAYKLI